MKTDYSRLPQALIPTVIFIVAAALCQTLSVYLFRNALTADPAMLFNAAVMLALVIIFRFVFGPVFLTSPDAFKSNGVNRNNTAGHIVTGVLLYTAAIAGAAAMNITAALLIPSAVHGSGTKAASLTVLLSCACIIIPACEEMIFRCHLFPVLLRMKAPLPCALICSMLFGIYHEDLVQGIYACVLSLFLCACYLGLDGFKSAFLMHAMVNLAMIILSRSGLYERMAFPAAAAAFAGISAVCIYTYFSLRRVLHL